MGADLWNGLLQKKKKKTGEKRMEAHTAALGLPIYRSYADVISQEEARRKYCFLAKMFSIYFDQ